MPTVPRSSDSAEHGAHEATRATRTRRAAQPANDPDGAARPSEAISRKRWGDGRPWHDDDGLSDNAKTVMDLLADHAADDGTVEIDAAFLADAAARLGLTPEEAREVFGS